MNNKDGIKKLELEIIALRTSMVSTAHLKGFNHPDTFKHSQELDQLLNEYQQTISLEQSLY